jgi:hypothetical protein
MVPRVPGAEETKEVLFTEIVRGGEVNHAAASRHRSTQGGRLLGLPNLDRFWPGMGGSPLSSPIRTGAHSRLQVFIINMIFGSVPWEND